MFFKNILVPIKLFSPDQVYLVFDGQKGAEKRRLVYPQYKTGRGMMSDKNGIQFLGNIKEIVKQLPIILLNPDGIQGDDTIAHIVLKNKTKKDNQILIVSSDKDFYQLIWDNVFVFDPIKKQKYDTQKVVDQYGIHPINFSIYKSIMGDSSDSIPGIKGFGPKTILKSFGQQLKGYQPIKGQIQAFINLVSLKKNLINIDHVVRINENVDSLKKFHKIINLQNGLIISPMVSMDVDSIIKCNRVSLQLNTELFMKKLLENQLKRQQINQLVPLMMLLKKCLIKK